MDGPWHDGERRVQERVGEAHLADRLAGGIRTDVPPVGREFLAGLPQIVVAATDDGGRIWVSALTGPRGFLVLPRPDRLTIAAVPAPGDPLETTLSVPARVGLIALEPETRTRVRLNGRSAPTTGTAGRGLDVALEQVFANCPKHIRPRVLVDDHEPISAASSSSHALDGGQAGRLAGADTFFVGTTDDDGNADASHRGGPPGVIDVLDATHLRFPDYRGISMYQTLGNLELRPAIGLLVPDWSSGGALHLTGRAHVEFELTPELRERFPRAQRMITVEVDDVVDRPDAFPLRWAAAD